MELVQPAGTGMIELTVAEMDVVISALTAATSAVGPIVKHLTLNESDQANIVRDMGRQYYLVTGKFLNAIETITQGDNHGKV